MFALSRHLAAAGFLISGPAFAEEKPSLQFAETQPQKNYSVQEMNMNFLLLKSSNENGVSRETAAIYDNVVGLACEWTQETKERDGSYFLSDAKIVHKTCVLGSMPDSWKKVESGDIGQLLNDTSKTPIEGEFADIEEYQGSFSQKDIPEIEMTILFQREWNKSTQEVCIQTYISENDTDEAHEAPELGSVLVEHGCYQLKDYGLKSAIALQLGQGI